MRGWGHIFHCHSGPHAEDQCAIFNVRLVQTTRWLFCCQNQPEKEKDRPRRSIHYFCSHSVDLNSVILPQLTIKNYNKFGSVVFPGRRNRDFYGQWADSATVAQIVGMLVIACTKSSVTQNMFCKTPYSIKIVRWLLVPGCLRLY